MLAADLALIAVLAAVGLPGVNLAHFCLVLTLLGIGLNFGVAGASALVLQCHRPKENARVQSLNDFLVFETMGFGSFLSGSLLTTYGWSALL